MYPFGDIFKRLSICTGSRIERSVLRVGFMYEQLNSPQQKKKIDTYAVIVIGFHATTYILLVCRSHVMHHDSKQIQRQKCGDKGKKIKLSRWCYQQFSRQIWYWFLPMASFISPTQWIHSPGLTFLLRPNIFSKDRSNQKHTDNTNISQYKENSGQWWSQDDLRNTVIAHTV